MKNTPAEPAATPGPTPEEKIAALEAENAKLKGDLAEAARRSLGLGKIEHLGYQPKAR